MVHLKTDEELQIIRESAQILGRAHGEVAKLVKPGVKTSELDRVAEEFIRDSGGIPSLRIITGSLQLYVSQSMM
jgi:methionyl aminopeptidase